MPRAKTASAKTTTGRRGGDERARDFVQKAVEFFSEVGFDGGTRALAQRLGVTQPLLYRYFSNKDDLIRAVYQKIYLDRWDPQWDAALSDLSRPLRERLLEFYETYTDAIFTREWLRIYLFAGLRGGEINRWYLKIVREKIVNRIVIGLRHEHGLPTDMPVTEEEAELVWALQAGIFYYGVRKYIFETRVPEDKSLVIANSVDAVLSGSEGLLRRVAAEAVVRSATERAAPAPQVAE